MNKLIRTIKKLLNQCIENCNECYTNTCEYHSSRFNPIMTSKVLGNYNSLEEYEKELIIEFISNVGIDEESLKGNK